MKTPIPTVHMNGTGFQSLMDQTCDASEALRLAIKALSDMAPNARDYYVQKDPNAFTAAATEHNRRIEVLVNVYREIGDVLLGISQQQR